MPEQLQKLFRRFAGGAAKVQSGLLQDGLCLQAFLAGRERPLRVRARVPYARPERVYALGAKRIEDGAGDETFDPLEGLCMQDRASVQDRPPMQVTPPGAVARCQCFLPDRV